jgi:hypothetical protein
MANNFITRTMIHAERRASEMKDVITTLESMGLDASMSKRHQGKAGPAGKPPLCRLAGRQFQDKLP